MTKSKYYHDTLCGLSNVYVKGISEWTDIKGNEGITIPNFQQYMRTLLVKVITKQGLLTGEEVRFLRTAYGKTQSQLAHIFNVSLRTVQRWESDEKPIEASHDLRLRIVTVQKEMENKIPTELLNMLDKKLSKKINHKYTIDINEVA